jgi:hypothetical protein
MTNAMHYKISEFLPRLQKIPFIGKALFAALYAGHVLMVYNQTIRKGAIECQNQHQHRLKRKSATPVTR